MACLLLDVLLITFISIPHLFFQKCLIDSCLKNLALILFKENEVDTLASYRFKNRKSYQKHNKRISEYIYLIPRNLRCSSLQNWTDGCSSRMAFEHFGINYFQKKHYRIVSIPWQPNKERKKGRNKDTQKKFFKSCLDKDILLKIIHKQFIGIGKTTELLASDLTKSY